MLIKGKVHNSLSTQSLDSKVVKRYRWLSSNDFTLIEPDYLKLRCPHLMHSNQTNVEHRSARSRHRLCALLDYLLIIIFRSARWTKNVLELGKRNREFWVSTNPAWARSIWSGLGSNSPKSSMLSDFQRQYFGARRMGLPDSNSPKSLPLFFFSNKNSNFSDLRKHER